MSRDYASELRVPGLLDPEMLEASLATAAMLQALVYPALDDRSGRS